MRNTTLALGLATILLTGASVGCKKKKDEGDPKVDKGSGDVVGSGGSGGMAGSGSAVPEPVKPLVGEALAKAYLDCAGHVNASDWDKFKGCMTDDVKNHDAGMNADMVGADKVVAMMKDVRVGFPDMKMEPQVVLVNGRNIAAVSLMTGTNSGDMQTPMGTMKATNKKLGMLFFHRLKINDANKATEEWFIDDATSMMGQLGMLPKEAPPGRPLMEKGLDGAPMIVVAADDDKEKANLAAFTKSTEAFNSHKSADVAALYTDDTVESDMAADTDTVGKKDVVAATEFFWNAFSDGKVEVTESWAAGDYVVAIGTFSGTNDGDMGKAMKKTGKKITFPFVEITQFKDGKIAKLWRFRNGADMAMQLGMMKMPESMGGGSGSAAGTGSAEPTK